MMLSSTDHLPMPAVVSDSRDSGLRDSGEVDRPSSRGPRWDDAADPLALAMRSHAAASTACAPQAPGLTVDDEPFRLRELKSSLSPVAPSPLSGSTSTCASPACKPNEERSSSEDTSPASISSAPAAQSAEPQREVRLKPKKKTKRRSLGEKATAARDPLHRCAALTSLCPSGSAEALVWSVRCFNSGWR
jgi:hypothetical protein